MIRLMLSAVGVAFTGRGSGDESLSLTPEEQLRRFSDVCERLSADDAASEERGEEE